MNKYTIQFEKAAIKFLKKQDTPTRNRLLKAINQLPSGTDIKRLQGYDNLYRMRISDIRVIYSIEETLRVINIENIGNRGEIYKRY